MGTHEVRFISVSINRDWRSVYEFAHLPENFPSWASGLTSGIDKVGDDWVSQGPEGQIRIRFSPPNEYGVLDHVLVFDNGTEVSSPLRIVATGDGCEVTFVLFRRPEMTQEAFVTDAEWVARDLQALKKLLEN